MSVAELLSLENKPWANLNVNSINLSSNPGGFTGSTGLNTYSTAAFTLGSTGATGANITFQATVVGNLVNLSWPILTFTPGITGTMNFGIGVAAYGPPATVNIPVLISSNSTPAIGYLQIGTTASLVFSASPAGAGFASGATAVIYGGSASYYTSA